MWLAVVTYVRHPPLLFCFAVLRPSRWRGVGRGCRVQAVTWMLLQGAWKKVKCVSTATLESSEGIVSTTRCVSVTGVR